jgi:hypothetical protein
MQTDRNTTGKNSNTSPTKLPSNNFTEFDQIIDQLENKLSNMKLENHAFLENFDLLNDECLENEEKNKVKSELYKIYILKIFISHLN